MTNRTNGGRAFWLTIGGTIAICVGVTLFFFDQAEARRVEGQASMERRIEIELRGIRECLCDIKEDIKEIRNKK